MSIHRLFLDLAAEAARPELAWMESALCAEVGGGAWFAEKGEPTAPAKRVCRACPVRSQCLDYALEHNEHWGIWGMTSPGERRALRRDRQVAAA